jgi:hypothetical protein
MRRQKPVSSKTVPYRSLIDLGALSDFDLSGDESGLIQRVHALRKKLLRDFTPDEIRLCVSQGIGLEYLVPQALDILGADAWVETEYYPGDLLSACIDVERSFWDKHGSEKERMREVLRLAAQAATAGRQDLGRQERRDLEHGLRKFDLTDPGAGPNAALRGQRGKGSGQ